MTDIARLRFKSIQKPKEHGALILSDDGQFRVEPSREFRDEMARLEEAALHRARVYGTRLGVALLALGTLAVGLGWFVGRVFGKLGSSLSLPRPVEEVQVTRDGGGGVHVTLRGIENKLQLIQMGWNGDEVRQAEADAFMDALAAMQKHEERGKPGN